MQYDKEKKILVLHKHELRNGKELHIDAPDLTIYTPVSRRPIEMANMVVVHCEQSLRFLKAKFSIRDKMPKDDLATVFYLIALNEEMPIKIDGDIDGNFARLFS